LENASGLFDVKRDIIPVDESNAEDKLYESPRVLRRLQSLREWSYDEISEVFPRSPRACCTYGAGDLFLNEAEQLAPTPATQPAQEERPEIEVAAHKRKNGGRKPLDPALPREVVRYELPADQLVCPHDGSELVEIGVEVSEQLDIIAQQIRVIRHERVKYACKRCDHGLKVAPVPLRIIPKGLFTQAALAWIILSKFMDALPLYRIAALLRRFGGDISRNTLAACVIRIGEAVQPVINLMRDVLLDSAVTQGDETNVQVLKEPGRAAQSKSAVWVL